MWRLRMTQRAWAPTRLTKIFQHRGETRKPRSNCSRSLKGVRARGGAIGREALLYFDLMPSVIRRDGDDAIGNFRVAGLWTIQEWSHNMTDTKNTGIFNEFTKFRIN